MLLSPCQNMTRSDRLEPTWNCRVITNTHTYDTLLDLLQLSKSTNVNINILYEGTLLGVRVNSDSIYCRTWRTHHICCSSITNNTSKSLSMRSLCSPKNIPYGPPHISCPLHDAVTFPPFVSLFVNFSCAASHWIAFPKAPYLPPYRPTFLQRSSECLPCRRLAKVPKTSRCSCSHNRGGVDRARPPLSTESHWQRGEKETEGRSPGTVGNVLTKSSCWLLFFLNSNDLISLCRKDTRKCLAP